MNSAWPSVRFDARNRLRFRIFTGRCFASFAISSDSVSRYTSSTFWHFRSLSRVWMTSGRPSRSLAFLFSIRSLDPFAGTNATTFGLGDSDTRALQPVGALQQKFMDGPVLGCVV